MLDKNQPVLTVVVDAARSDFSVESDVYVYEAPVRLWHWVNAAAILVLGVTGYFIGAGTPTMSGEATDNYLFGYVRFAHFSVGYVLTIGFLLRIYWMFMGSPHARQIFYVPFWRKNFWADLWHEMCWYAFVKAKPKKYVGHNPLAQLAMFSMFTLTIAFMIGTGFALYAQGAGNNSWQYKLFGWVFSIWPNSQDVHTWHHLGLWMIVTFVLVHIYSAIREDIMSRQGSISSMISGGREFRD
ncbi:Ni/Fe-hydrogenase, b-type cytochrome subunit [Bradyrhizobium sp. CB3481]|uniref:Ni/Fe-hydrogenase, b-type cytochrome subunit n=1 Tax=Bradyrhizobium sp. CB3481 TaxID=3039158 RepID=UPI0024B09D25|nr:Ni/Fe-hydrogenase, b-type cytochrome subunit [Bradyrhizobium sp. CB3481]WFU20629.1 Ni/Fe-hydrogenase, b-type cytochrome subunit [Bradyrhizobium sp. CB3481]